MMDGSLNKDAYGGTDENWSDSQYILRENQQNLLVVWTYVPHSLSCAVILHNMNTPLLLAIAHIEGTSLPF